MNDRKIKIRENDIEVPDNSISTSKYTVITFFPKNLFEQFSKLSNFYFLVKKNYLIFLTLNFFQIIGVLQVFPDITNTDGQPLIYLPLFVIIGISMVKDFMEDYKRWTSDKQENNKIISFYNGRGEFRSSLWKSLRIGDLVKVK